jgi:hypothetical protein
MVDDNAIISSLVLSNTQVCTDFHIVISSCSLGLQNMATSCSQRNGKTLDPKVSILIFQVVQGDAIRAVFEKPRY